MPLLILSTYHGIWLISSFQHICCCYWRESQFILCLLNALTEEQWCGGQGGRGGMERKWQIQMGVKCQSSKTAYITENSSSLFCIQRQTWLTVKLKERRRIKALEEGSKRSSKVRNYLIQWSSEQTWPINGGFLEYENWFMKMENSFFKGGSIFRRKR